MSKDKDQKQDKKVRQGAKIASGAIGFSIALLVNYFARDWLISQGIPKVLFTIGKFSVTITDAIIFVVGVGLTVALTHIFYKILGLEFKKKSEKEN